MNVPWADVLLGLAGWVLFVGGLFGVWLWIQTWKEAKHDR